jgi:hypothetical protein
LASQASNTARRSFARMTSRTSRTCCGLRWSTSNSKMCRFLAAGVAVTARFFVLATALAGFVVGFAVNLCSRQLKSFRGSSGSSPKVACARVSGALPVRRCADSWLRAWQSPRGTSYSPRHSPASSSNLRQGASRNVNSFTDEACAGDIDALRGFLAESPSQLQMAHRLCHAARNGHVQYVNLLLEHRASPDLHDGSSNCPEAQRNALHEAGLLVRSRAANCCSSARTQGGCLSGVLWNQKFVQGVPINSH